MYPLNKFNSPAGLSLQLADFNQQRSECVGSRSLAFNALVIGRTRKEKREDNKKDKSEDVAEVGVRDDVPLALKRMSNADKIAGKVSFLTTNREDKVTGESASGQQQIKKQETLMQQQQQQDTCEPICRIYKVDLTGNFHRCQAAAIGVGADEVEKWMRLRGSYLATKVKVKVKATPEFSSSSSLSSNLISSFVNSVDTLYELEPAAAAGSEKGIGADGDNDGGGDEKDIEMIECLGIAECCLREVYRVSDIPDVEVHVATIQGYELWG